MRNDIIKGLKCIYQGQCSCVGSKKSIYLCWQNIVARYSETWGDCGCDIWISIEEEVK